MSRSTRRIAKLVPVTIAVACGIPDDDQYFAGGPDATSTGGIAGASSDSGSNAFDGSSDSESAWAACFACGQTQCAAESAACEGDSECVNCAVVDPTSANCQTKRPVCGAESVRVLELQRLRELLRIDDELSGKMRLLGGAVLVRCAVR